MSIITPSGLPTELTEITNGETLIEVYNPDTGQNEKTEIDTISTYVHLTDSGVTIDDVMDYIFPIGKRVIQLPGESSPATLYTNQTWSNISSTFAGDFFRVEGGKANTYDSGEQEDAMQRITGDTNTQFATTTTTNPAGGGDGALDMDNSGTNVSNIGGSTYYRSAITFDSANSTSPNAAKTDDDETRPVNWTIRIWERTA
jgi:hypothetical protein